MPMNHRKSTLPSTQRGGALLVAMILIFMLSVMGVSSMKGSTLERRMASNSIQTATTFQSAESTSEMALNNTNNLDSALAVADYSEVELGNPAATTTIPIELKQDIGLESEAELRFVGFGPAIGYSASFAAYRFEVVGGATVEAIRANKQITQGAYRIAPKPTL